MQQVGLDDVNNIDWYNYLVYWLVVNVPFLSHGYIIIRLEGNCTRDCAWNLRIIWLSRLLIVCPRVAISPFLTCHFFQFKITNQPLKRTMDTGQPIFTCIWVIYYNLLSLSFADLCPFPVHLCNVQYILNEVESWAIAVRWKMASKWNLIATWTQSMLEYIPPSPNPLWMDGCVLWFMGMNLLWGYLMTLMTAVYCGWGFEWLMSPTKVNWEKGGWTQSKC